MPTQLQFAGIQVGLYVNIDIPLGIKITEKTHDKSIPFGDCVKYQ